MTEARSWGVVAHYDRPVAGAGGADDVRRLCAELPEAVASVRRRLGTEDL